MDDSRCRKPPLLFNDRHSQQRNDLLYSSLKPFVFLVQNLNTLAFLKGYPFSQGYSWVLSCWGGQIPSYKNAPPCVAVVWSLLGEWKNRFSNLEKSSAFFSSSQDYSFTCFISSSSSGKSLEKFCINKNRKIPIKAPYCQSCPPVIVIRMKGRKSQKVWCVFTLDEAKLPSGIWRTRNSQCLSKGKC